MRVYYFVLIKKITHHRSKKIGLTVGYELHDEGAGSGQRSVARIPRNCE